jgi:hypothetical protein
MNAMQMSEAIRSKRKKLKEDGVDNMVDTAALPQMNPQDVLNLKQKAQMEETMDLPSKEEGPSDPADATLDETQEMSGLKKRMAHLERILGSLKMSK